MSQIKQLRSGTNLITDVYERQETEGDALNFFGSNAGLQQLSRSTEDTASSIPHTFGVVVALTAVADPFGTINNAYDFTLSFGYLVGAKQLIVLLKAPDTDINQPIQTYGMIPRKDLKDTDPSFAVHEPWFEEIDSNTVRVHNLADDRIACFTVPHTAVPSVNKEKITVKNQGNNEALEFEGPGDGAILRAPNGSRWLHRVDDSGTPVYESR